LKKYYQVYLICISHPQNISIVGLELFQSIEEKKYTNILVQSLGGQTGRREKTYF